MRSGASKTMTYWTSLLARLVTMQVVLFGLAMNATLAEEAVPVSSQTDMRTPVADVERQHGGSGDGGAAANGGESSAKGHEGATGADGAKAAGHQKTIDTQGSVDDTNKREPGAGHDRVRGPPAKANLDFADHAGTRHNGDRRSADRRRNYSAGRVQTQARDQGLRLEEAHDCRSIG